MTTERAKPWVCDFEQGPDNFCGNDASCHCTVCDKIFCIHCFRNHEKKCKIFTGTDQCICIWEPRTPWPACPHDIRGLKGDPGTVVSDLATIVPKSWPILLRESTLTLLNVYWTKQFDQYENPDNHRIARGGNAEEVAAYLEARKKGCCGQEEECWVIGDELIIYGFDYGH